MEGDKPKGFGEFDKLARKLMQVPPSELLSEKVNRLLHDAEHALSGSEFADRMKDHEVKRELRRKYDRLVDEAQGIDPSHSSLAWAEHAEWLQRRMSF